MPPNIESSSPQALATPESLPKTYIAQTPTHSYQQHEEKLVEQSQENKGMMELMDLLKGNENEANEFLKNFGGSASVTIFIKNFENIKLAEEHLIRINKEWDGKTDNSCGDNCKWIFDEKTKTLFIRGSGKMNNYGWDDSKKVLTTPWSSKREQIENVMISEGITAIGEYVFYGYSSLKSIMIPNSATTIRKSAFYRCSSLTSITISNNVTTTGEYAFRDCSSLITATLPKRFESQKVLSFGIVTN